MHCTLVFILRDTVYNKYYMINIFSGENKFLYTLHSIVNVK